MTDKRRQTGIRSPKAPAIACLIGMVFVILVASWVEGGTHSEMIRVTGYSSDPETTIVKVFQGGNGGQVGDDSVTSVYPDSFPFTLDSGNTYSIECYEIWWDPTNPRGLAWIRDISLRLVTASASLSAGDIAAIADTLDNRHGATSWLTGGGGTGTNDIVYYAQDTSGTDEMVHGVGLTCKTIIGGDEGKRETNTSGYTDPGFTSPAGSLVTSGHKLAYVWIPDTANRTGNATDTIFGYNVPIDPAPEPNFCRVYGWATTGSGFKIPPVVQFTPGDTTFERCDSTFFDPSTVTANTSNHADSVGYFWIDLRYSSCVGIYTMVVGDLDGVVVTVPSEATWRVVW